MKKFTMSFALEDKSVSRDNIRRDLIAFSFKEEHLGLEDDECPSDHVVTDIIGFYYGNYKSESYFGKDRISFIFTHACITSVKDGRLIENSGR